MKIGYKATYNMKCESLTYEVGKEYHISSMQICDHGFHFCDKLDNCLKYYNIRPDTKFIKIEILGEVQTRGNKSVTDRLRVLEVIKNPKFENYKFDDYGNMIYKKHRNGREYHYKFDDHGNKIYEKNPNGDEYHYKYDDHGNLIYEKHPDGDEYHYKYDEHGNKIYEKYPDGDEYHYKYDEHGNIIYKKYPNGEEWILTIL